jgi:hypothetical protein
MKTSKASSVYYFALGEILKEKGLTKNAARIKYGFDNPGNGYISKTGFQTLCHVPLQIKLRTLTIICNAMGLTPGELWREKL